MFSRLIGWLFSRERGHYDGDDGGAGVEVGDADPALSADPAFRPARGWIRVGNGGIGDIEAAIVDYGGLTRAARPGIFSVELHPQGDGAVAVLFPDGFPAYDLANMTGWLGAPPQQPDVHDAVCWLESPGDGVRYRLEPELDNDRGDTLVGASADGRSVRVYLPETGVGEISQRREYVQEPELELSPRPVTIGLVLDTDTGFGNPDFLVESPLDQDWGE
ncbi:hypothetical protein FKV24_009380 [Lysobacter maris]|uniref:Uncharacterized protein n=1 Tax=Marilutibacter maris TaxID=1605891 RepID=A0A508AU73_9GAMM|nr:hypothetical protein [Lysobacter maris]KAB8189285.1 hypothetical protein FKV24_009380 [Lysobacter maris]